MTVRRGTRHLVVAAIGSMAVLAGTVGATPTPSRTGAGPALEEDAAALEAALACDPEVDDASVTPVLLVHGTAATSSIDFSWNLLPAFASAGVPTCTVEIPDRGFGDLQRNVEYVVHAVRRVAERSGRRIAVIGHSQGGFLGLHAVRFWPDVAARVDDWIGYATATIEGTTQADGACVMPCTPAFHQFRPTSSFLGAVRRTPLPPNVSFTSILTLADQVVTPQPSASTVVADGAVNVVVQDHCPQDPMDHLAIVGWQGGWELVLDALANNGPADPSRIGPLGCGFMPEVARADVVLAAADFTTGILTGYPPLATDREPPLRCYLTAEGCAGRQRP